MTQKRSRKSILNRLKAHSKFTAEAIDGAALADSVGAETDRGAIIILGTVVEDTLTKRLEEKMVQLTSVQRSALFEDEGRGPLSTFSAKTNMAHALGIIDADIAEACTIIRHMRNACAHSQKPLSFDDEVLRDAFTLLCTVTTEDGDRADLTGVPFGRYLLALLVAFVTNSILYDRARAKAAVDSAVEAMRTKLAELRRRKGTKGDKTEGEA